MGLACVVNRGTSPGNEPSPMRSSQEGPEGPTFIHGPTATEVQSVEITLSDGRDLEVPTEAAPEALGVDLRFYAAAFEGSTFIRKVAAKNDEGKVVDELTIPPPPKPMPPGEGPSHSEHPQ